MISRQTTTKYGGHKVVKISKATVRRTVKIK